ncbi:hypothetical protein THII_2004 [Thioploca ingrica]|uniref:Uncharacterized protein n=1 Tax=Thioploca ingrica TaxID=40754 RepID=A0A090BV62_9GAMM|nr:hypothetical protein THII_2004 [Thioploca ingrica]
MTVDAASDEVVYSFETPGALLSKQGQRLARNHPNVQAVFAQRRVQPTLRYGPQDGKTTGL